MQPDRRAGQRRRLAEHQPAEVDRVQPVDVLVGSTRDSSANSSSPVGCWTRKPVHAGSALSSSMTASTSAWVAVGGQVAADAGDADLGAVLVLGADVPVAARVVADQHRAEPGHDAAARAARPPARGARP